MIHAAVTQMSKMLLNLDSWLESANELATEQEFAVENFLQARLAPDMFNLVRQIQSACDTAKFAAARLSGTEAPRHPDDEKTLDELRSRIQATVEFISSISAGRYDGAAERLLTLPFTGDKQVEAGTYFVQFAQPNFYFHATTAYDILRHNGVKLGKRRFIGPTDM